MKYQDIKPCTACGGEGWRWRYCEGYFSEWDCPHCLGTGLEPVRIQLVVPDGYVYHSETSTYIHFVKRDTKSGKPLWKEFELPHPFGQELEIVCDDCGGKGTCGFDDKGLFKKTTCPSCNGNPKRKVKLKEVAFEGNELIEYWEEV